VVNLAKSGMTMLEVTHETGLPYGMADRVKLIGDGLVVESPKDIY